jgi:curved DNA-binding protein CbpA
VATNDDEAIREAVVLTGKPPETLRAAAAFFIEQILLRPGADSYHVLGVEPNAPAAHLRQNLALLLRWLHPDVTENAQRSIFVTRVTTAWNDLKTPEKRAAYDLGRVSAEADQDARRGEWSLDMSAISEFRKVTLYEEPTTREPFVAPARADRVQPRKNGSFLHRLLLLLMGELDD